MGTEVLGLLLKWLNIHFSSAKINDYVRKRPQSLGDEKQNAWLAELNRLSLVAIALLCSGHEVWVITSWMPLLNSSGNCRFHDCLVWTIFDYHVLKSIDSKWLCYIQGRHMGLSPEEYVTITYNVLDKCNCMHDGSTHQRWYITGLGEVVHVVGMVSISNFKPSSLWIIHR